jgi:hypothetical protein
MIGAALMLAHQVSGKAVRDSFFLSNYPASDLPKVVFAAAIISVVLVLIFARLIGRFGPSLMVPAGFFLSALLHLIEFFFVQDSPGKWSIVIYFHIVALSSVLLSGFWSVMTEVFDPRAAKQVFGRITAVNGRSSCGTRSGTDLRLQRASAAGDVSSFVLDCPDISAVRFAADCAAHG